MLVVGSLQAQEANRLPLIHGLVARHHIRARDLRQCLLPQVGWSLWSWKCGGTSRTGTSMAAWEDEFAMLVMERLCMQQKSIGDIGPSTCGSEAV